MSTSDEECPVCRNKITNLTQPSSCCGKRICQTCLSQCLRYRSHCPHCRGQMDQVNPLQPSTLRQRGLGSRQNSGSIVYNLLQRYQAADSMQRSTANPSIQNAPAPVPQIQTHPLPGPIANAFTLPTPMPRTRAPPLGAIRAIPPAAPVLNAYPGLEDLETELDEWPWQTEIHLMEGQQQQPQSQSSTVRTFACPYCLTGGLDELDLLDHCNSCQAYNTRPVVCPVCVAMPHGDPQYYSRNFIQHLNLRHCYYAGDITNVNQSDEINIQCALMASFAKNT